VATRNERRTVVSNRLRIVGVDDRHISTRLRMGIEANDISGESAEEKRTRHALLYTSVSRPSSHNVDPRPPRTRVDVTNLAGQADGIATVAREGRVPAAVSRGPSP
jgi:hypothetical protein